MTSFDDAAAKAAAVLLSLNPLSTAIRVAREESAAVLVKCGPELESIHGFLLTAKFHPLPTKVYKMFVVGTVEAGGRFVGARAEARSGKVRMKVRGPHDFNWRAKQTTGPDAVSVCIPPVIRGKYSYMGVNHVPTAMRELAAGVVTEDVKANLISLRAEAQAHWDAVRSEAATTSVRHRCDTADSDRASMRSAMVKALAGSSVLAESDPRLLQTLTCVSKDELHAYMKFVRRHARDIGILDESDFKAALDEVAVSKIMGS